MKKRISILLIALLFLPCVLIFTFCGNVEYSIVYVLNGGENNLANPVKITNAKEFVLKNPTREYCDFLGWYTETTYENKIVAIKNIKKDITLYAKWKLNNNYFIKECVSFSCVYKENENLICCKGYNLFTKDISSLQIGDRIVWSQNNKSFVLHTLVKINYENGTFVTSQSQFADNGDLLPIEQWDEEKFDFPLSIDEIYGKQIKLISAEQLVGIEDEIG